MVFRPTTGAIRSLIRASPKTLASSGPMRIAGLANRSYSTSPADDAMATPSADSSVSYSSFADVLRAPESEPFDTAVFLTPELPKPTHYVPTATVHFRSHDTTRLRLFMHFVLHAASALNIPATQPASLPIKRTLITVPKSPFVHKSAQENFQEKIYKRSLKVYDTDPVVLSRWLRYLQENMLAGVAMKAVRWERVEVGVGKQIVGDAIHSKRLTGAAVSDEVKALADKIVREEMEALASKSKGSSTTAESKSSNP